MLVATVLKNLVVVVYNYKTEFNFKCDLTDKFTFGKVDV